MFAKGNFIAPCHCLLCRFRDRTRTSALSGKLRPSPDIALAFPTARVQQDLGGLLLQQSRQGRQRDACPPRHFSEPPPQRPCERHLVPAWLPAASWRPRRNSPPSY